MKKKNIFIMAVAALSCMSCSERIDAGCEGILVNMYGDDKGVDGVSLCTGRVWYNPFTEEVYEYPTYVQTIDYKPFTINAKDGSEFTIDPTISLKIIDGRSPVVFKKYRKELKDVIEGTLYNYVKDAFRIQLNRYTTDEIVSNRALVERASNNTCRRRSQRRISSWSSSRRGLSIPTSSSKASTPRTRRCRKP